MPNSGAAIPNISGEVSAFTFAMNAKGEYGNARTRCEIANRSRKTVGLDFMESLRDICKDSIRTAQTRTLLGVLFFSVEK